MAKMETLKLEVDTERFREGLKAMVDGLVEQATASLELRIRMIVRNELDLQKASAPR